MSTKEQNARRKAQYWHDKLNGICIKSSCKEKVQDHLRCEAHHKLFNEQRRALRSRYKEKGLCIDCGTPAIPNQGYCIPHNEMHNKSRKRYK